MKQTQKHRKSGLQNHIDDAKHTSSKVGDTVQIKKLQSYAYQLITDSQEIEGTLRSIGKADVDAGCLLVKITDGDYEEVWSCTTGVPYLTAYAERVA